MSRTDLPGKIDSKMTVKEKADLFENSVSKFQKVDAKMKAKETVLFSLKEYIDSDIHSRLNSVYHQGRVEVDSTRCIQEAITFARSQGLSVSIAGGRHAMGGQQFVHAGLLLDTKSFNKVRGFDPAKGLIKVESGIMWFELIARLAEIQKKMPSERRWSIIQKPTGADNLSIGGCLSANVHGRGLDLKPFVQDIENFEIVNADGEILVVSRENNRQLFNLVVGGYGLFGVIATVTLRLKPRAKMKRCVQKVQVKNLMDCFNALIEAGHEYGDFQFAIDNNSEEFLRTGILASYKKYDGPTSPSSEDKKVLSLDEWKELLKLAHCDKSQAFEKYLNHYLKTDGQLYWSDTMQLSTYMDDYHKDLDELLNKPKASEIITELYVPRNKIHPFMEAVRTLFVENRVDLIYGTIRLIRQDDETFLPWAKDDYVCVIFNLHTEHGSEDIKENANVFRQLIKIAKAFKGNFYLTYHRYVEREDLDICYPQFKEFLQLKQKYDPDEIFQSQWYRHYRSMYDI